MPSTTKMSYINLDRCQKKTYINGQRWNVSGIGARVSKICNIIFPFQWTRYIHCVQSDRYTKEGSPTALIGLQVVIETAETKIH